MTVPARVEVVNFAFWPYAKYFDLWAEHPGCVFPLKDSFADLLAKEYSYLPSWLREKLEGRYRLPRFVHVGGVLLPRSQSIQVNIAREESLELGSREFLKRLESFKTTTISGWRIADWKLVRSRESGIRELFRPALRYEYPAREFLGALRKRYDWIVGVLVRQSDYRTWSNGDFYYTSDRYARWIGELIRLYADRRVAFVLASEEYQDPGIFAGLPVFLATGNPHAGGHWFENWVELTLCDVILSAPSTFSATAAFRGGIPLWPVMYAEQVLDFDQLIEDGMVGAAEHPIFSRVVK